MAIFRESAIIGPISGALGGAVLARSKAGPVARHRPPRINRPTAKSLAAQAAFVTRTREWAALSDAQRAQWNSYARAHPLPNRLGVRRLLSGFQWWCRLGPSSFQPTSDGIALYAGFTRVWLWSFTTSTLYLDPALDIDMTSPVEGPGQGAVSTIVWTDTQHVISLNVDNQQRARLDLTAGAMTLEHIASDPPPVDTDTPAPAVTTYNFTYFRAYDPTAAQWYTYAALDIAGTLWVPDTLDTRTGSP